MPVKGLYTRQQLFVVSKRDEDLSMVSYRLLENGERALTDLMLLQLSQLGLVELRFWDVDVLTTAMQLVSA